VPDRELRLSAKKHYGAQAQSGVKTTAISAGKYKRIADCS
jgi:hypothetical protein